MPPSGRYSVVKERVWVLVACSLDAGSRKQHKTEEGDRGSPLQDNNTLSLYPMHEAARPIRKAEVRRQRAGDRKEDKSLENKEIKEVKKNLLIFSEFFRVDCG